MATAPVQIPFSNPGGKNQTNPSPIISMPTSSIPGSPQPIAQPVSNTNPYVPPSSTSQSGPVPFTNSSSGATPNTSSSEGFITNNSSYSSGQNDLQKQLIDIYGKGVGGSLFSLLNNMSGTDSTILQEYIQSLQPQMAKAQADTNSTLGAGGVSANSSVSAIADASLQSQETASIASESANLTQSQEQLTAQLLSGMEGSSAKEVATSGWNVLGDVLTSIPGIGNIGSGLTNGATTSIPSGSAIGQSQSDANSVPLDNSGLYNPPSIAEEAGASLLPFG